MDSPRRIPPILPRSALSSPARIRRNVLLPQPFLPTRPTRSLGPMESEAPSSIARAPKYFSIPFALNMSLHRSIRTERIPLPEYFIEHQAGGDAQVERIAAADHGNPHEFVAG